MNRARISGRAVAAALLAVTTALAVVASAGRSVAGPAAADETTDDAVAVLKARVTHRIDLRLQALRRLDARVDGAEHLGDEHRDTLDALIETAVAGLTDLRAGVAAATTREELRADLETMVNDYRVFILVLPKVRLTIVADRELAAIDRLGDVHDRLAGMVERAEENGRDTGNAAELLDAMQTQLDAAAAGVAGQVDTLLAIEPGPDGAAIRAAVDEIRESLREARQDIRDALATGRHIGRVLRGHR